jgi:hypothetical protein
VSHSKPPPGRETALYGAAGCLKSGAWEYSAGVPCRGVAQITQRTSGCGIPPTHRFFQLFGSPSTVSH